MRARSVVRDVPETTLPGVHARAILLHENAGHDVFKGLVHLRELLHALVAYSIYPRRDFRLVVDLVREDLGYDIIEQGFDLFRLEGRVLRVLPLLAHGCLRAVLGSSYLWVWLSPPGALGAMDALSGGWLETD